MNSDTEKQVQDYIQEHESDSVAWGLSELINTITGNESSETGSEDKFHLFDWLKNDTNLMAYAELVMKTEKLNIWESLKKNILELKLSITCSYFADFKIFLEELKKWENTNVPVSQTATDASTTETRNVSSSSSSTDSGQLDSLTLKTFCWISVNEIKSEPYYKNPTTWVTWCSYTARLNWEHFWLSLPNWDAYKAWTNPWNDALSTIPSNKRTDEPSNKWKWIASLEFASISKWNYADIYIESKSTYGHRAAAFKADDGQRYVLDPYTRVNWVLDNSPKKIEDYINTKKIVKAHIYESDHYKKELA